MTVELAKGLVAALVFAVALLGGLIVGLAKDERDGRSPGVLHYGEYFAHGVFLGAGLLHLLPEAMSNFATLYPQNHYPVILLICALSILVIQWIDEGVLTRVQRNKLATIPWLSYTLMVLLSIHSIIAGATLGLGDNLIHVMIIFIAIISHKGAAAFALAVTMRRAGVDRTTLRQVIFLFALMTPLGILFGTLANAFLASTSGLLFEAIFGAIAAGTFLTVAFGEHGMHPNCAHADNYVVKFSCVAAGILLMALIAGLF